MVVLHKHFYEYMQDVCRLLEEYVADNLKGEFTTPALAQSSA